MIGQTMGYGQFMPMTPQMAMVSAVEVSSEDEANRLPVGIGQTVMLITRDDSMIFVKSATQSGVHMDVYDRRQPKAEQTPYPTRDEIAAMIEAAFAKREGTA